MSDLFQEIDSLSHKLVVREYDLVIALLEAFLKAILNFKRDLLNRGLKLEGKVDEGVESLA